MKNLRIGICGWGNIATGLYKTILENKDEIYSKSNLEIEIVAIGARRDNPKCVPENVVIERNIFNVLNHKIDVMIELIGGVDTSRELILNSIDKGIDVVTANKAVLFNHGDEIFQKARDKNVNILFESSVCAGTPIIKLLQEELAANTISKISGMLNGTSNFIMTKMEEGANFDDTLILAQENGYAEPDPSFDIEGMDAAHKIGILSSLAFGTSLPPNEFYIEGIKSIESDDFMYAAEYGYTIKHLAVAAIIDNYNVELRAHPALISSSEYLSNLKGVRNGIEIETDLIGKMHIAGSGAGQGSTASGIISDLVFIANKDKNVLKQKNKINKTKLIPFKDIEFRNYFHIKTNNANDIEKSVYKIFESLNVQTDVFEPKNKNNEDNSLIIISKLISENTKFDVIKKLNKLENINSLKTIRIEK